MNNAHRRKLTDARREWTSAIRGCASDDLEQAIAAQQDGIVHANQLLGELVERARNEGWSWERIGAAMGVSRSAAWQRWHNLNDDPVNTAADA